MASTFPLNPTKVRALKRPQRPQKKASPKITYDPDIYKEARDSYNNGIDITELECCGGREISNITGYAHCSTDILLANIIHETFNVINDQFYYNHPGTLEKATATEKKFLPAFFLFTDIFVEEKISVGERLKNFIEQQNLGDVSASVPNKNNNSGNLVQGFLWTCDRDAIADWWNKKGRFYID